MYTYMCIFVIMVYNLSSSLTFLSSCRYMSPKMLICGSTLFTPPKGKRWPYSRAEVQGMLLSYLCTVCNIGGRGCYFFIQCADNQGEGFCIRFFFYLNLYMRRVQKLPHQKFHVIHIVGKMFMYLIWMRVTRLSLNCFRFSEGGKYWVGDQGEAVHGSELRPIIQVQGRVHKSPNYKKLSGLKCGLKYLLNCIR